MAGSEIDAELKAVKTVYDTLKPLKADQREFVLRTVCEKLEIKSTLPVRHGGAADGGGVGTRPRIELRARRVR